MDKELREKFKKLYREKFNIDLTDEEATEMSTDLINLVKVILKPDGHNETNINSSYSENHETYRSQQYI